MKMAGTLEGFKSVVEGFQKTLQGFKKLLKGFKNKSKMNETLSAMACEDCL